VTRYKTQPPWEFLLSASRTSLQSYELTRLSHAANLRKEIGTLLDQWLEENACAMLARWLMEQRERPATHALSELSTASSPAGAHSVSDNFLKDQAIPPRLLPADFPDTSALFCPRLRFVSQILLLDSPVPR
jgi:hypothetical protein